MSAEIRLTRVKKHAGALLCKRISAGEDGRPHSDGSPCAMGRGTATRVRLNGSPASDLCGTIMGLDSHEALVLGDLAEAPSADGALYCLLRVHTPLDSMTLAERLVREHKVATIPGPAFGLTAGCSLRISYGALAPDTVAEGIDRLVAGLGTILRTPA